MMKVGPKRSGAQRAEPTAAHLGKQDRLYEEGQPVLLLLSFLDSRCLECTFRRVLLALRSWR